MRLVVDQRFARVTLARFVACYLSEEFNEAVARVSGLKSRRLVDEKVGSDGRRDRRVRMQPDVKLPAAIERLAPIDKITYDEVSSYDPATHSMRYQIDSAANDRVKVAGMIRFIEDGDGVRRTIDGVIEVNAPLGLGGVIERFIEAETQKGYAKIGAFLQQFLDERA